MKRSALVTCLALGSVWGCTYIFLKWSFAFVSPLQATFLRVVFGLLPIACYALATNALKWRHLRHGHHFVVMSLLSATVYYLALATGTARLPSGIAGLINGAIPLFACVGAWLFLRDESLSVMKGLGICTGFAGILLLAAPGGTTETYDLAGVGYTLLGAACFGASFVYARRFLTPLRIPAVALATYQMAAALLTLVFVTPMDGMLALTADGSALAGLVLGVGVFSTGIGYIFYYRLVETEGAVNASVVTFVPPVVALLISNASGEALPATAWISMLTILLGVGIVQSAGRHTSVRS